MSEPIANQILLIPRSLVQACLTLVNETITSLQDNPMYAGKIPIYLYEVRHELCAVLEDSDVNT